MKNKFINHRVESCGESFGVWRLRLEVQGFGLRVES
jgi:hypothetical protein